MTQELLQEKSLEKPNYNEWLQSLKQKVESVKQREQEEIQWKQRYGKG